MEEAEIYNDIRTILTSLGLPIIAVIAIVIAFFFPDRIKIWVGVFQYHIGRICVGVRKSSIKNRLEGACTHSLKKLGKELPDLEIPELSIKWVKEDNLQAKLKEGKAIVKLRFSDDQTRNIINAATVYVKEAFLIHSKPYMSENFVKAMDFSITKKILLGIHNNKRNVISEFIKEYALDLNSIQDKCSQIEVIDDAGLFTRILIRELDFFGNKLIGRNPSDDYKNESDKFLSFLHEITTRDADDLTPLQFVENILKVGVLLVAKKDTYYQHGLHPYLRRIKLGLARGIKTFYLLAREDKVEILESVAKELLLTGNFILINNPRSFSDSYNREVICYCLRIDTESSLTSTYREISLALDSKDKMQGVVTKLREDGLKVDVNGVEGFVQIRNLSASKISDIRKYFKEKMLIELIPIEIGSTGIVEFTLINTCSDPNNLINANFEIGRTISAKVKYCDDDFVKFDVGHEKIEGISFRKDLTYSRFSLLHKQYELGTEHDFIVKNNDFENNTIYLRLKQLKDPWDSLTIRKFSQVNFLVCRKVNYAFIGELQEGIEGILAYKELSWFSSEIEVIKNSIKLNNNVDCVVKDIDKEKRIIYLTLKDRQDNPYFEYLDTNRNKVVEFFAIEETIYGILGSIESKYQVFIPKNEQSWNGDKYNCKIGKKNKVVIKELSNRGDSLIGTFRPLIPHPLALFSNKFDVGQILKPLKVLNTYNWGATFIISIGHKKFEALLFKGDISNLCFIKSCIGIFDNIDKIPLAIKEIDLDKNRVILSLKEVLKNNLQRSRECKYANEYESIIIGSNNQGYVVLLKGLWIEAILESTQTYETGKILTLRPARLSDEIIILTDE